MIPVPWLSVVTIATATLVGLVLLSPRIARRESWRATVTPLASIIGSGFLVLGPLLLHEYGSWAPGVMLALCVAAYGFGASVRANIEHLEPLVASGALPRSAMFLERASGWMLAAAYVISVAYYLNLLGSFAVSLTSVDDRDSARIVTTAALGFIGLFGLRHGLKKLEILEEGAVTLKLAIIAGLLVALVYHALHLLDEGQSIEHATRPRGLHSLFVAFGLVITVQGFETSRYLGEEHGAAMRIRTMRFSQWISTGIYMVYLLSLTWAFDVSGIGASETAIIGVTAQVAPVLPAMLVLAALAAQFSAAVADTAGCGGLLHEISNGKLSSQVGYAAVMAVGVALTWSSNVFEIIAYGSRAFAAYYTLQSLVAAVLAWQRRAFGRVVLFGFLGLLGASIALFGATAE